MRGILIFTKAESLLSMPLVKIKISEANLLMLTMGDQGSWNNPALSADECKKRLMALFLFQENSKACF
jgi:hypothetical protein